MKISDVTPNGNPASTMICTMSACGLPAVVVVIDGYGEFTGDAACSEHVPELIDRVRP